MTLVASRGSLQPPRKRGQNEIDKDDTRFLSAEGLKPSVKMDNGFKAKLSAMTPQMKATSVAKCVLGGSSMVSGQRLVGGHGVSLALVSFEHTGLAH
jgi:hypothetical protein